MKILRLLILLTLLPGRENAQDAVKGFITEADSVTPMPFVYVIRKSDGHGTISNTEGRFSISCRESDTLIVSYIGYLRQHIPVKTLRPDAKGDVRIPMIELPMKLEQVTINTFRWKDYEREYMNDIIDRSRVRDLDYVSSPFSALYMRYSREGRQIRKLARIFEDLLMEEAVQKKMSREIVVKLTGDEQIDYEAFRKYCYYINNNYIVSHDGAELYSNVLECYDRWKKERRQH
jgi:hypothetical protein